MKIIFQLVNHKYKLSLEYHLIVIIIALVYASLLAIAIPSTEVIKDRINYLGYADSSSLIVLDYLRQGWISVIFNEPIWLGLNIGLKFFLTAEQVVNLIIFFSAFTVSYLILKVNPKAFLFLLLLLFLPQVIGKFVVHLRQGLAISIFLVGWFTASKPWRWFLFALTPLIHVSFFFVVLLLAYVSILNKLKFALDLRTVAVVALGLTVGIGLEFVAGMLGARQIQRYEFSTGDVSGLGFLFWLVILALYWMQGRTFAKKHAFEIATLTFYLTTYFLIEVTGRIFESTIAISLLAGLNLTAWRRAAFIGVVIFFAVVGWLMNFGQPWLGWGV